MSFRNIHDESFGNIISDVQCCRLVEQGVTETLLELLRTTDTEGAPTLQHAILSALRNLAIPQQNKPTMLSTGLLDIVLPFREVEMMAVQFKLLGLLRMIVDKQGIIEFERLFCIVGVKISP